MDDEENRLFLHSLLQNTFPDVNLYYRPPGNILLEYPCIIYEKTGFEPSFANSETYVIGIRYRLTFLSELPGYSDVRLMYNLTSSGLAVTSSESYKSNDIIHDVFTISVNSL